MVSMGKSEDLQNRLISSLALDTSDVLSIQLPCVKFF